MPSISIVSRSTYVADDRGKAQTARTSCLVCIFTGLKTIVDALIQSLICLRDVTVLASFILSIFALVRCGDVLRERVDAFLCGD